MHNFSSFSQGLTSWYNHAIYIVFTYFASFTGLNKNISHLHVEQLKFCGKMDTFGGKYLKKLNSVEFMDFVFSKSARWQRSDPHGGFLLSPVVLAICSTEGIQCEGDYYIQIIRKTQLKKTLPIYLSCIYRLVLTF